MKYRMSITCLIVIFSLLLSSFVPSVFGKGMNESTTLIQESNPFILKLSQKQMSQIEAYLDNISDFDKQSEFQRILDYIIENEDEFNVLKLFEVLKQRDIDQIFHPSGTTEFTDDLYMFLLNLIEERLGWIYDFFQKTSDIISDTQRLWNDRGLPKEIINETQNLITTLRHLQSILSPLIEKQYIAFLREWSPGVIIQNITTIINSIQTIARDLGILKGDIQRFIFDVSDFIQWFSDEPWTEPIVVYGQVIMGLNGLDNVTVQCNGVEVLTDNEGLFEFVVNTTLSDASIPPQSYYGLHQCIIQVNYEDQEKDSSIPLSYVFSDGAMFWFFVLKNDDKSNDVTLENDYSFKDFIQEKYDSYYQIYSMISRFLKRRAFSQ